MNDQLRKLDIEELEELIQNNVLIKVESFINLLKGIIREKYNGFEFEDLIQKLKQKEPLKNLSKDVLKDSFRKLLNKGEYYQAWTNYTNKEIEVIKELKVITKDVFNEKNFEGINYTAYYLNNISAFISHFDTNNELASELRKFLMFFGINTFTDHDDGGSTYGANNFKLKLCDEIKKRPTFILLANKNQPSEIIRYEIKCNDKIINNERLRLDILLDDLPANIVKEYSIDIDKHYFELYKYDEEKIFNDVYSSIYRKYKS